MNRNSITFKLFIITIAFFVLFISITLFLQSAFFEQFYTNQKVNKMEKGLEKLKVSYISSGGDIDYLIGNIREFQDSGNVKVAVINRSSMISYTVISSQDPSDDPSKDEILRNAILQWSKMSKNYNSTKSNKYIVYNITHPIYKTNNIVVILPVVSALKTYDAIIAVSSLQPVGEAVSVMNQFYIYIYSGAVLVIIILSLIYSNMLSKPLVSLNKTAKKMADLDFSTRCAVKSKDEIGSLSDSLNFLSDKLDRTLKELNSANEKLKSDIDRERNLEKMRKEFIAGVSHELKTPISLIGGYAEGIKDGIAEDEERDYYIDVIMDETKKMGALVADMLDLSQLDSGSYKLKPRDFYLYELVVEIVKKHSNVLQQKKITVEINTFSEDIVVYADHLRIEQVITNILTNAIRHTPDGKSIIINIKDDNSEVMIEVENQGSYIDEQDIDKIWDRFYKIDKARNRDSGGTGLGLAIVKDILLLHDNRFGAVNTENGVLFFFTLKKSK